jgi:hypothetical protein
MFVLFIMLVYSFIIVLDRTIRYSTARIQSRALLTQIAGAFDRSDLDEAFSIAARYNRSHIASVLVRGLTDFTTASIALGNDEKIGSVQRKQPPIPFNPHNLNIPL